MKYIYSLFLGLISLFAIQTANAQTYNFPTSGTLNVTDCAGTLYDSGGPNGEYQNNETGTVIIDPPGDDLVAITFTFFDIEASGAGCFDGLFIYDGVGTGADQFVSADPTEGWCHEIDNGTGTGDLNGMTFISTGDAITLSFDSDGSVIYPGWEITFGCISVESPPIPGIAPFVTCDGSVEFSNIGVTADAWELTYEWDLGDGTISTDPTVNHVYTTEGTYDITLEICNQFGCTDTVFVGAAIFDSQDLTCFEFPMPAFANETISSCVGVIYDNGGPDASGLQDNVASYTIAPGGNNLIELELIDLSGIGVNGDVITIYDGPDVTAPIIGVFDSPVLPINSVITSGGNSVTVEWEQIGFNQNPNFEINFQCIEVVDPPTAAISSSPPYFNCGIDAIAFQDVSGNAATSWTWNFGDGTSSNEENPIHTFVNPGMYDVELIACNDNGCDTTVLVYDILVEGDPNCEGINMIPGFDLDITECSGILYDSGGPTADYENDESSTVVLGAPSANSVTLIFTQFTLPAFGDAINVYDGENTFAPLLGSFTGDNLPNFGAPIVSSGEFLTVELFSGAFTTDAGFEAYWLVEGGTEPPAAGFSVNDLNPPFNVPIQITDETTEVPTSWFWDFGDGENDFVQNPEHAFTQAGENAIVLTASNCLGTDISDTTIVTVQGQPFMIVDEDAISITIPAETSLDTTFNIQNFGGGDLVYEIDGFNTTFAGLVQVLAYEYENPSSNNQDIFGNLETLITGISDGVTYNSTSTNSVSELETLLENINIFLVPGQQGDVDAGVMTTFAPVLEEFVNNGGVVLFMGTTNSDVITNTGLLDITTITNLENEPLTYSIDHPLVEDVEKPFSGKTATISADITNTDINTIIENEGQDIVAYREQGEGKVLYIGFNYLFSNESMKQILENAILWTGTAENAVQWLFADPFEGQVTPGFGDEITLTFNAIGAPGGTFTANLIINSNDPDNSAVIIPITLTIIGTPGFAVDLTELDFGNVIQFTTESLEIVISNPGSDSLFVTDIIMPNSDFTASISEFGLFPSLTQTVDISFSPQTVIIYEDLVMTIVTNIGSFDVLIDANATGAPIVGAIPAPIEITLNVDESGDVPLTINNTGLGFLEYCLESNIEGGSTGFDFTFFLDFFNDEFFWQLLDSEGNIVDEVVAGDGTYPTGNTEYTEIINGLSSTESYTLLIQDTFGDGALDDYTVSDISTGAIIVQGQFATGDFVQEELGSPVQNPLDQWMTFDIECDTLDFPGATDLTVSFDATGFLGGVYETTILVISNDPQNPVYEIPVIMTVIGIPELGLVNGPAGDAYDFGSVLIGLTADNTLTITNSGTDNLIVSDFDFSNDQFSINATDLDLAPGDTATLTITFAPDVIGDNNATLTLVNNDMDITFDLISSGQGAPFATVNPSEIVITLLSGETATEDLTIFNTGEGNLDYEILVGGSQDGFEWCFALDNFNNEFFWQLVDSQGNVIEEVIAGDGTYPTGNTDYCEVFNGLDPSESYTLLIQDNFGDGALDEYTVVDLASGEVIVEGSFTSGDFLEEALGSPTPPTSLVLSVTTGNIGFPDDETIMVTIDADGALAGVYEYIIAVQTNDPANPIINVTVTVNVIAFPQALFTADNEPLVCGDDLISFTDNSVNVPTEWLWDFGDGTSSMEQNPTHAYSQTGTYTVSLIASNNVGSDTLIFESFIAVDIDCQIVSINPTVETTIDACNGQLFDSGGEGDNYALSSTGTVVLAPAGAVSVAVSFVEFNYEDGFDSLYIYDGPDANSPLLATGTGTELADSTIFSTGPAMTIQESTDQFFSISGFTAFFQCEVPQAAPIAAISSELIGGCSGEVQFNDDSQNFPTSWAWDFGDGNTADEKDPSHQYSESGTYTVTLEVGNAFGDDMTTFSVDVFILTIEATIPTEGFSGNVTNFSVDNFQAGWTASWTFGDNTSANVPAPTHIYQVEDTTTYGVVLTVADANQGAECVETIEQTIVIYPGAPLPKASLTLQVDTRFTSVDPEGMHVMGDFNSWTPEAMTELNDSTYSITLEVIANQTFLYRFVNGSDAANSEAVPEECGTADNMGVFSRRVEVGDDAMAVDAICFDFCKVCITTGIEEITNANLLIAPNPSNGFLNYSLDLGNNTNLELTIVNALGQMVYQKSLSDQSSYQEKLDLTNLVDGVYWIHFTTADKQLTQPFVLQR